MPLRPADWGGRPVWAEVDLDALAHNVRLLAARAAPARLYAVVKANAYGHGAIACARTALEAGASALAVAAVDEGEELRRAGIDAPILVLGFTPASDAARAVALGLQPTVAAADVLEALSAEAVRRGRTVSVQLELESGLNRHGLPPEALVALAERARGMPGVDVRGLWTHFAAVEEGDLGFTRRQFETLRAVAARLPWIPERHCAASASVLLGPEMGLSAVRAGLALYGYRPSPGHPGTSAEVPLRPVLSLRARLGRVLEVEAGASVGYGRAWTATRPTRVGLVMCGYADGYRRGLSGRAHVLVRGRRAPLLGRVAMDMCMADVSEVPGAMAGDVATLLGTDGTERVDADALAALEGTISWEVLAGISARVPRLYVRDGLVSAVTTLTDRVPRAPEG